jgi:D-3-phosphoglycerate dehydrogenase / 2-oxoglutarate reductase
MQGDRFMRKVLIAPAALAELGGPYLELLRDAKFEIVYPPRTALLTEAELQKALEGVSASIAGSEPYTRDVIAARPGLRVIARVGVGYDAVDCAAASEHGVAVATAPGTNHDAVAEHTFALILALAKRVVAQDKLLREGRWPRQTNLPVRNQTLGIVGLGRIGKAVALRGLAFKMPVIAYEPFPDHDFCAQHQIELVPLPQLLSQADYVTLHLPLSPETRHLIRCETLALMKPTAFLVNTARGGMVCEADLVEALKAGKIAGAGLDVFETEPTRGGHPLYQFENVVLTPHAAGGDTRSRDEMAYAAAHAIVALSRGEWPAEQIVNPEVRSRFRW